MKNWLYHAPRTPVTCWDKSDTVTRSMAKMRGHMSFLVAVTKYVAKGKVKEEGFLLALRATLYWSLLGGRDGQG